MILTFNPLQAMVKSYSYAEVQGQRSVGSEDGVETNGQTDGGDCITSIANVVGNDTDLLDFVLVGADKVLNAAITYDARAGSDCQVMTITRRTASLSQLNTSGK